MNTTIMSTVLAATGVTYIKDIVEKEPLTLRPLFGGFFVGIGLFAIGAASPKTAEGLAMVILVTALVMNSGAIFKASNKLVGNA